MSRRPDLVRQAFEDFNAGRFDAWTRFWTDETVLHELPEIPDRDRFVGFDGLREWLANIRGVLGEFRFDLRTLEERGDYVLASAEGRGAGAGAGVPGEWPSWIVFRFEDEMVVEAWGFLDEDQARRTAGMQDEVG
jgi:hypothetical protein